MYRIVSTRHPRGSIKLDLPGSHVTPLALDPTWTISSAGFSPLDALGMAAKVALVQDAKRACVRMIGFMDSQGGGGVKRLGS